MTRDFANKDRKPAKTKKAANASPRGKAKPASPPWTWFIAGLLCGVFLSGLTWLAYQQPDSMPTAPETAGSNVSDQDTPKPRFDFYTLLPEQTIDVDPETIASARTSNGGDQFLLQAGSFRQAKDADRRRAQILLLGLDAHVEEAKGDTGRWFRVYIGPYESRSRMARARSLTAQQGIDTLLLRRPAQG